MSFLLLTKTKKWSISQSWSLEKKVHFKLFFSIFWEFGTSEWLCTRCSIRCDRHKYYAYKGSITSIRDSDPYRVFFLNSETGQHHQQELQELHGFWCPPKNFSLAAKCSTKNHFVRLSVCLWVCLRPFAFLPFTKKIHTWKFSDLTQYIFADAPMKKKIVLPPLTALLGHPLQNIFFALIIKIFLQTLVDNF